MKKIAVLLTFMALIAAPAFALTLEEARKSGSVGETLNGYVATVKPGADVEALVKDVNAKRREHYMGISKENGQPLDVVEKLAAEKLIANPEVQFIKNADGSWKKK